jgi:hypothetical protein
MPILRQGDCQSFPEFPPERDGCLNSNEGRQKVADVFRKETRVKFDVDRIHSWFRNHKSNRKKRMKGGTGGGDMDRWILEDELKV